MAETKKEKEEMAIKQIEDQREGLRRSVEDTVKEEFKKQDEDLKKELKKYKQCVQITESRILDLEAAKLAEVKRRMEEADKGFDALKAPLERDLQMLQQEELFVPTTNVNR